MKTAQDKESAKAMPDEGWELSRWWRVIAPDGSLWCETSDMEEARNCMREGDTLERLYMRTENRWVPLIDGDPS